ncbi:RCC1 domain-containing protein 1 [Athalia rosae]|uniref:RCC1 domain-containing protein 1 n=1 Tax=Athalia rosae TaxID=37344 RepID=UPI002033F5AB|nr:RCC1 domain-containing protein 1 [Athalia rosae]
MKIYYTGLNNSKMFCDDEENAQTVIEQFTEVPFAGIEDIDIGWNYMLLWRNNQLFVSGEIYLDASGTSNKVPVLLELSEETVSFKQAIAGKETITVLSTANEIYQYKIFERRWKKVMNFIHSNDDVNDDPPDHEYPVKIFQGGCTVALTNHGRVYNIPTLVEMPKRVKFVDVACGFDHTIMLAENGDVYSMGMGTRGQLGHGDLEDCDIPQIIEALAGLKVIQIAASGWHTAVVTDQGDLYTWGWNNNGQLGINVDDTKVFATPTAVDITNKDGKTIDAGVKKVQCGNSFTICMLADNTMWGCGSNKYGQLGMLKSTLESSTKFVELITGLDGNTVEDFKCREWGSVIVTN